MTVKIIVEIPPAKLSQNARVHWHERARLTRIAKADGYAMTIVAMDEVGLIQPRWSKARMHTTFYWASNRRRDVDNANSRLKATIDGIVQAGLIADDSYEVLTKEPPVFEVDKHNPRVEIVVEKQESEGEA